MAWVALLSALGLFAVVLFVVLYALFFIEGQGPATAILAGIDGTLGLALRQVYFYLFPTPK